MFGEIHTANWNLLEPSNPRLDFLGVGRHFVVAHRATLQTAAFCLHPSAVLSLPRGQNAGSYWFFFLTLQKNAYLLLVLIGSSGRYSNQFHDNCLLKDFNFLSWESIPQQPKIFQIFSLGFTHTCATTCRGESPIAVCIRDSWLIQYNVLKYDEKKIQLRLFSISHCINECKQKNN